METKTYIQKKMPAAILFAAFIIIIAGIIFSASLIKPLLMAVFIGIICAQPISWMQKKKVPKGIAIGIVLVGGIILFSVFGIIIGNSLYSFSSDVQKYEQNLFDMGNSVLQSLSDHGIDIEPKSKSDMLMPAKIFSFTQSLLGSIGSAMGSVFTVIFLVLFLLFELDSIPVKITAIFKGPHGSLSYLRVIGANIRHYLSIKTLVSLLTGILVWGALKIIGVDYAIIWALIAFLLNYIPNIGSIIAAIPAVLFAFVQLGFGGALWTTLVFVAVNMIIGNVVEPKVMGKGLGLSTFVVFVSLLFWGFVLGTVGMFLSVPLTMAIKIMLAQNEQTKWIAILLGSEDEAQVIVDGRTSVIDQENTI